MELCPILKAIFFGHGIQSWKVGYGFMPMLTHGFTPENPMAIYRYHNSSSARLRIYDETNGWFYVVRISVTPG